MSHDGYSMPAIPGKNRAERNRNRKLLMKPFKQIDPPRRGPNRKMRRAKKIGEDT